MNVKGPAELFVTPVEKRQYASIPIAFSNMTSEETWIKYQMDTDGSIRSYGTMLYKVGQFTTFTGDFAGEFVVVFNADKVGHKYMVRAYLDEVACWTSEMICEDPETGMWVGSGTVHTGVEIPAGIHTIRLELVYANDDTAEIKLNTYAALNCSLYVVSGKVAKEQVIAPTNEVLLATAKDYMGKGNFEAALPILVSLGDYSDAKATLATCENTLYQIANESTDKIKAYEIYSLLGTYEDAEAKAMALRDDYINSFNLSSVKVGDTIKFGHFEQDGDLENGKEEIEWYVLDKTESQIFVISKYVLESGCYHQEKESVDWEHSSIRAWLNEVFLDEALNAGEQSLLVKDASLDFVSLLTASEAETYIPDTSRKADATNYAKEEGIHGYAGNYWWWIKNDGDAKDTASIVFHGGHVDPIGISVDFTSFGIRPVLTISLSNK